MQACHLQTGALSLQRKGFVSLPISQRGRASQDVRPSSEDFTVKSLPPAHLVQEPQSSHSTPYSQPAPP